MNEKDYMLALSESILRLRKEKGLTQENLAEKMNISYQAVSKWENGQSCPDISALPVLANVFDVSIDELFGRKSGKAITSVPWEDDGIIRGAVYKGKTLLSGDSDLSRFTFVVEGDASSVEAGCNVTCNDVLGDANAGVSVTCGNVGGDAIAGVSLICQNVSGNAEAGVNLNCNDVGGSTSVGIV